MPDQPLYVIVDTRVDGRGDARTVVYDCHPDADLADVRARADLLQSHVAGYGRPNDTYRVAELRFVEEG